MLWVFVFNNNCIVFIYEEKIKFSFHFIVFVVFNFIIFCFFFYFSFNVRFNKMKKINKCFLLLALLLGFFSIYFQLIIKIDDIV